MNKPNLRLVSLSLAAVAALGATATAAAQTPAGKTLNVSGEGTQVTPAMRALLDGVAILNGKPSATVHRDGAAQQAHAQFVTPLKAAARAASRTLWGYLSSFTEWPTASCTYGYMSFDAATAGNFADLKTETADRYMMPNGGGALVDGVYNGVNYKLDGTSLTITHYQYDTRSGWGSLIVPETLSSASLIATETASSKYTGKVYGQFYTTDMMSFEYGVIDYDKLTRTTIGPAEVKMVAMGVSSDEKLYGVGADGYLYLIDTATGKETKIGSTGVYVATASNRTAGQSGEIDQDDDTFYWACIDAEQHAALYTVDLATGRATKIADFPAQNQVLGMAVPDAVPDAAAPAAPTSFAATFDGPSLQGTVTFGVPSKTYGGQTLSGSVSYTVRSGAQIIAEGEATAGTTARVNVTAPEGPNYFSVTLHNAAGKSIAAKTTAYVGYDQPKQVSFARMSLDASTGIATVTWGKPSATVNGGYMGTITYDIVRYPGAVTVAQGTTATQCTDQLPSGQLGNYYYGVTPVNGTQRGQERFTAAKSYGESLEPTFTETFDSENAFDLFTTIDSNADGNTWDWAEDRQCARYKASTTKAADDWLVTPPVHLQKNHRYTVSFKARNSMGYFPETIEAKYGNGPAVQNLTSTFAAATELKDTKFVEFSRTIDSDSDQKFYLGIHAISDKNMAYIYVDDFTVTDEGCLDGPAAATGFAVTPDASGALRATVSFTLPTKTVAGSTLAAVKNVTLSRDGVAIKEFGAQKPGAQITYTDATAADGFNTYTVVAESEAGAGTTATCRQYVGIDVPSAPNDVLAADNITSVALSWDAATATGTNGGAVVTSDVTYNIYRVHDADGSVNTQLVGTSQEPSYTDNTPTTGGSQQLRRYAVAVRNAKGESAMTAARPLISGDAYAFPFVSGCGEGEGEKLWWTADDTDANGFTFNTQLSADGDSHCLSFTSYAKNGSATISTGKIALSGATSPAVVFSHLTDDGASTIDVYASRPDGSGLQLIGSVAYTSATADNSWHRASVKIPAEMASLPYVIITFKATADQYKSVRIDDVNVRNAYANDLAVSLTVPESVMKGENTTVTLTVANNGDKAAKDYKVTLRADGKTIMQQTVSEQLAALERRSFTAEISTDASSKAEAISIEATVEYAADENTADNTASAQLQLTASDIPTPQNLTATQAEGTITLSWTAPQPASKRVREGFEKYDNWAIDAFGSWTTYTSQKGSVTGGMWGSMGMPFPHETEKYTYIVFNPEAIQEGITSTNSSIKPHGGDKCLMSMWSREGSKYLATDDWLISPMLSGEAQTILFWANNGQSDMSNIRYPQTFEVLYSEGGNDHSEFKSVASYTQSGGAWQSYTADVPEGANYFAVRCTTNDNDAYIFLLDDVVYYAGYGKLSGFNVYCNGQLVKQLGAEETQATFTFDPTLWRNDRYSVSAVFVGGESEAITGDDCVVAAIDEINAGGNAPYDIYTTGGVLVKRQAKSLDGLRPGVYIVNRRAVTVK